MNNGRLVFSQITDMLDPKQLSRCLQRYPMPRASKSFSASDQFLSMVFAQLTFREGLRDIEACLRDSNFLYAMGIRGRVTRTNIAYANEYRDWRVYADVARILIRKAQLLYSEDSDDLDIDEMVYAVDSTTIDLCLSMFPWATFRSTKSAIKIHTKMAVKGSIPVFMDITEGSVNDMRFLDRIPLEPGSIYVMDRGYVDFERLYAIAQAGCFFVIRGKRNLDFHVRQSRPVNREAGFRCDQSIRLAGVKSRKLYPILLRRIHFIDPDSGQNLVFLTNHFALSPETVAEIYKSRWRIELFFKWIKQNLRIKAFYGRSENAVKTQIWIAICTYLMVACLKKTHAIEQNLARILQVLSVNVFMKDHVNQLLANFDIRNQNNSNSNQLMFNDF
jgi:hypothetical protein